MILQSVLDQFSQGSIKDIISELDKEAARITISKELRGRYKKKSTVITGIKNMRDDEIETMTSDIKTKIGTGGTYKEGKIILQGDHRESVKRLLIDKGFNENSIEVL
jgi:translation initiation factor 1